MHKADILKLHSSICINSIPPTDVNQVLKFRSGRGGGHGAYDQRIKIIAKMLKKSRVVEGGVGIRVDMNKELKLLLKLPKKKLRGSGPGVGCGLEWMKT